MGPFFQRILFILIFLCSLDILELLLLMTTIEGIWEKAFHILHIFFTLCYTNYLWLTLFNRICIIILMGHYMVVLKCLWARMSSFVLLFRIWNITFHDSWRLVNIWKSMAFDINGLVPHIFFNRWYILLPYICFFL